MRERHEAQYIGNPFFLKGLQLEGHLRYGEWDLIRSHFGEARTRGEERERDERLGERKELCSVRQSRDEDPDLSYTDPCGPPP